MNDTQRRDVLETVRSKLDMLSLLNKRLDDVQQLLAASAAGGLRICAYSVADRPCLLLDSGDTFLADIREALRKEAARINEQFERLA